MSKLLQATTHKLQLCLLASLLSTTVVAQGVGSIVESKAFDPNQPQFRSEVTSPPAANNDAMSLLLDKINQIQTENQALREMVERGNFELKKLQRDSLSRYTNMDERLSSLESAAANPVVSTAPGPRTARDGSAAPLTAGRLSIITTPNATAPTAQGPATATSPLSSVEPVGRARVRATLEPAVLSEQQLYQMAYNSVINNESERSVAEFDQYLSIYPEGRFVINAHYWKGQAYNNLKQYAEALEAYETIMNQYSSDEPKYADAMYGLALAYEGLGNIAQARQLLNDIKSQFPLTGVANLADTRLLSLD